MAGRFEATIVIDRPIENVFEFLADGENDKKFSSRIIEIEKTTEGPPGVGTVYASTAKDAGVKMKHEFELTQFEPPTRIRWGGAGSGCCCRAWRCAPPARARTPSSRRSKPRSRRAEPRMDEHGPGIEEASGAAAWIAESPLFRRAYILAAAAHSGQSRPSDGAPFLAHVVEVATLLHEAGFDDELVAAGLLHDAVERGTLAEQRLRAEMGDAIWSLVLAVTEDATIESFAERKEGLREQVRAAGEQAITIFAADKLSDIRGLRRGIDRFGDALPARIGTTVDGMAGHYRESVEMIEVNQPDSTFVPALLAELAELRQARPPARL